jgi:hypothetical protein
MLMFCTPPATIRSHHRLCREVHGLLARPALPVDRRPRHLVGESGREPARARDVAGLWADRVDAAEHDVVDRDRIDAGALDERADRVRAEVGGVHARQPAAAPTDR